MGFSLFSSKSKQEQETNNYVANTSENTNVQDAEGIVIGKSGGDVNVYSVSTDHNAVGSATDLAKLSVNAAEYLGAQSMELSRDTSERIARFGEYSLDAVAGSYADALRSANQSADTALDYQRLALGTVAESNFDALSAVSESWLSAAEATQHAQGQAYQANQSALNVVTDTVRDMFGGVTEFIGRLQGQSQDTLSSTVTSLNAVARENSKSTDQRLAESTDKMMKYAVIGVGLLAVAFIATAAMKKG